jgi:hypothetical protein
MAAKACHAPIPNKAAARSLILRTLGVRRVADWCGKSEAAVYQWLSRGTDEEPIPPSEVPAILNGAREAGLKADLSVLWPAMAEALAEGVAP